ISLAEAQRLSGRAGMASMGLAGIKGDSREVQQVAARSTASLPGLAARPIGLLSESEGQLLARARWLMIASSLAVLLLAALAVLTTSVAAALDREPELALLKALGWDDREAAALFLSEAGIVGLAAGLVAALAGPA